MKIHFANQSKQGLGGGWTFLNHMQDYFKRSLSGSENCDIYFISGATMVTRDEVRKAKDSGKKIVLRVDNAVRDSRNRGTGMSRLYDFAQWADVVVYQSEWARKTLSPFLNRDGVVIHNATDTSIYNTHGRQGGNGNNYLYSRYNRDETKNWEMARFAFQEIYAKSPKAKLGIVGQFSGELQTYKFDFYNGEDYHYFGIISDHRLMATILKGTDYFLYTYFMDACSNTVIEALCCGVKIHGVYGMEQTGGTPELIRQYELHGIEYFKLERMLDEYKKIFEELV